MIDSSRFLRTLSFVLVLVIVAACQRTTGGPQPGAPFIGGLSGLNVAFETNAPPPEAYDGGASPFSVIVKLRNIGEYILPKEKVRISILGVNPEEFSKTSADLVKSPPTELEPRRLDVQGNIVESNVVLTEFPGFNHRTAITGTALSFPIRAQVCYSYGTIARTSLCSRSDILNAISGGICELSGPKKVDNSGAPIQIEQVVESPRSATQVGFTFNIKQVDAAGLLFEKGSVCDTTQRSKSDRVFVDVRSPLGGISCSGLTGGTGPSNGFVQLYDKSKTVTCTQDIRTRGDYTFPVTIEVTYDFQSEANTQVIIKRSGTGNQS